MNRLKISKGRMEYFFLSFYFAISPISKLLERIGIPRQITYLIMIMASIVYVVKRYNLERIKLDVFIAFLILTPITLWGVLFHRSDYNNPNEMYAMLIVFYPAYFIMRVANTDKLIQALHTSAYIIIAIYLPNAFLVENIQNQHISYAYDILFPLGIIMYYAITERHWYDIAITIVGTILLVVFGSRGALLSLALFYLFIIIKRKKLKSFVFIMFLLGALFIVYLNLVPIITWLRNHGISSYTLMRIANAQGLSSLSRVALYRYIIFELLPWNILGYGPIGNRALMPVIRYHDYPYPHQLFLEILIDYGLIIGTIFSIAIIYVTVYLLRHSKKEYRFLAGVYCVLSLVPFMLSGSFYTAGTVPFIFALYMKLREDKKTSRRYQGDVGIHTN